MNFRFARDQFVLLKTAPNLLASRRKANKSSQFFFYLGGTTKHLMTGSAGNSEFCFPSTLMFPVRVSGKQNSLFPVGPVIKRLLFTHTTGIQNSTIFPKVYLWKAHFRAPTARQVSFFPLKLLHKIRDLVCGILHRPSRHHYRLSSSRVCQSSLPLGSFRRLLAFFRLHSSWRHFSAFSSLSEFPFPPSHHRCLGFISFVGGLYAIDNSLFSFLCQFSLPGWNGRLVWSMGLVRLICEQKVDTSCYIGHVTAWFGFKATFTRTRFPIETISWPGNRNENDTVSKSLHGTYPTVYIKAISFSGLVLSFSRIKLVTQSFTAFSVMGSLL